MIEVAKTRTTPYHPQGDGQVERLNKSLVKILSKLISDHRRDWADCLPKALLAYNTSVHESTGFTPYRLMFGREAILPLDAALKLDASPLSGSAKTYPEYVVQQKRQVEETERLVRENLKRAQKSQKACYDTKCYGQRFHAGDRVWYRNRTRVRRKKFLKPWCGPWRVIKALSDVTYRIEEERRKPGKRLQRRVVHFNYLKPCHSPLQETPPPPSSRELIAQMQSMPVDSGEVEMVAGNGGEMQRAPVNSGEVELEIPASPVTECQPDVPEDSTVLIPSSPDAGVPGSPVTEIPHQPKVPMESGSPVAEPSQRPRRERREQP